MFSGASSRVFLAAKSRRIEQTQLYQLYTVVRRLSILHRRPQCGNLNEGLQSVTTETMLWDGKTFGLQISEEKLTPDAPV